MAELPGESFYDALDRPLLENNTTPECFEKPKLDMRLRFLKSKGNGDEMVYF